MCAIVLRYFRQYQQFVMNTQQMLDDFFRRAYHTLSSYFWDDCQFMDPSVFVAFLWGEFRQTWTAFASRRPPAVEFEERDLPYCMLSHRFESPCGTFSLAPARCQAILHYGGHCNRRALTPFTLCRLHADAWLLPDPFPFDPTAGE